ncbi:MAG: hypothetical protein IJ725_03470, partial [Ruminococcus sp.]|nr:hypothetical protein [Ruminococcus sp.]
MKRLYKTISVILAIILLLTAFSVHGNAVFLTDLSNTIHSADGIWNYFSYYDSDNKETIYMVESYNGSEKDVTLPTEIDGNNISGIRCGFHEAENVFIPKTYKYILALGGEKLKTIEFSRDYEQNEILYVGGEHIF